MRVGILAAGQSWYLRDLERAAAGQHEIVPLRFDQLAAQLPEADSSLRCGDVALDELDVVLIRSMPPGTLEQVILRMDILGRLQATSTRVVNPPRSLEVAIDKYLATSRLEQAGLRVPETSVCQTADQALQIFAQLGEDVVVKPLFGSEGRGILRVSEKPLAVRTFRTLERLGAALYLQRYIPHLGYDLRLFCLGDTCWGMRRHNASDWRTNVSLGATTEPLRVTDELRDQANRAVAAVGAEMAGVDLLPGKDGHLYALEVNAVPGWKALARTLDIDVGQRVLEFLKPCHATLA